MSIKYKIKHYLPTTERADATKSKHQQTAKAFIVFLNSPLGSRPTKKVQDTIVVKLIAKITRRTGTKKTYRMKTPKSHKDVTDRDFLILFLYFLFVLF